jgi:hypothetical protein
MLSNVSLPQDVPGVVSEMAMTTGMTAWSLSRRVAFF